MKKILITNYYGLIEALQLSANALSKLNNEIYDYPLFKYSRDLNDKLENYEEHMIKYVQDNQIDVILWWYAGIETEKMEIIVNKTNVKNIFFNWDEPFNWKSCDIYNKAKLWDAVFVSCKETLQQYLDHGTKKSFYLLPGYDEKTHYPIFECNQYIEDLEKKYTCDISICVTNLYENLNDFNAQYLNRRPFLDNLYNNQDKYHFKFFIYGPEFLKNIYPKSYRGFISYENTKYVFNYSKINLCTHVISNKYGYINERCILIAGCGGLLYVDPVKGIEEIFQNNVNCVHIDKNNYLSQISSILHNYSKYYKIRHNIYNTSKNFTYDKWAEKISGYLDE